MIRLSPENHRLAVEAVAAISQSEKPVQWLEAKGLMSRGDVGKLSGLSGSTLRAIALGKKPSKAQLAALKYATLSRFMGL